MQKVGMTLLGVGVTNRPHVRLRDFPISLTEQEGKMPHARVPILVAGEYEHSLLPKRKLVLNEEAIDNMVSNWEDEVVDGLVALDARHRSDLGALVFFEKSKGGRIAKEKVGENTLLVGYGDVVSEKALEELKGFGAASAEIHLNYKSNLIKRLEEDKGKEFETGEVTLILESEDSDVLVILSEEEQLENPTQEEEDMSKELQEQLDAMQAQLQELQEANKTLLQEKDEALKLAEESKKSVRQELINARLTALKAPNDKGELLPAYVLNSVESILAGQEFSGVVALEDRSGDEKLSYYEEAVLALAENMPRSLTPTQTQGDDTESVKGRDELDLQDENYDPEAPTGLWGEVQEEESK